MPSLIAVEKLSHRIHIVSSFQYFGDTHRADPKTRLGVAAEPGACVALPARPEFIEKINQKRRIQKEVHFLGFTRRDLSPISASISARRSAAVTKGGVLINSLT